MKNVKNHEKKALTIIRNQAWVNRKKRVGWGGRSPPPRVWKLNDLHLVARYFLGTAKVFGGFEACRIAVSSRGCGHNDGI